MLPRKFVLEISLRFLVVLLFINSLIVEASATHSCYRCERDNCEDPVSSECKNANGKDKCFIRFNVDNNDIVEMGCFSELPEEEDFQELIAKKILYVCDAVNCNDFANLPNPNTCTECSSSNEDACATKPTTIIKQQACNNVPYTQCYQRINGGVTERGCLHHLEGEDFYGCLTGEDVKCKICEGKRCNEEIIPSERKVCHRCSSQTDASCESSPVSLSVCPIYNETDKCVAVYENGITKRGCNSEIVCDQKLKNCQICAKDGCNMANIKKRYDDIYGCFQDLPINCYTCKGAECDPGKPRNPNMCEGDVYQDCMTVFEANGTVIRRGCELQVLAEQRSHCNSYPDLCFNCKANGCNDITNPTTYYECLYCDATTNPDCLFNAAAITTTRKCSLGCVSSLYTRKSNTKILDFVRTCFDDIEPDDHESCTAENNCIKCLGNKCNTDILPAEGRLSCLHCNGSDCDHPTPKQCTAYNPNDMCYIYLNNGTSNAERMGCRSDIPDAQLRSELKRYYICDGDNCNDSGNMPEAQQCLVCDSKKDIDCVVNPGNVKTQEKCDKPPYTQCFTRVADDGTTQRGCLSNLATDAFINCHDGLPSSKCRICTEDNCNYGQFPNSRTWCFRCNSTTDPNCQSQPQSYQPCPIYKYGDTCITQWIKGTTIRGCGTDITCEGLGSKNCRECNSSVCNSLDLAAEDVGDVGLFTKLPLRCHECSSVVECNNSTGEGRVCEGDINQSCTTAFNLQNQVAGRGCSDRLDKYCSYDFQCFKCNSDNCNEAVTHTDYIDCKFCDSKDDVDCVFNATAIQRTRKCHKSCMTALYPRSNDVNPVYELIRTCLDDKNSEDRIKCESSKDPKCKSCSDDNCNADVLGVRKSCYQCQGLGCQSAKAQTCRGVMDNDQCFQRYDERGMLVELGCKSQYNTSDVETLLEEKYLWLCDDDNCNHVDNTPKPQACIVCNSKSDAKCATTPTAIQVSTVCETKPYTQCYSRVLQNGHVERGCMSNLEGVEFLDCLNNENSAQCLACTGNKCNQELYPRNRLSCHTCSSASAAACETQPGDAEVCLLYAENEKCLTLIDTNGHTARGCSSKISCSAANVTVCEECTEDGCNVGNLKRKASGKPGQWQNLPLSCLACNNLKDCSIGSRQEVCTDSDYCMTVFDTSGNVLRRGCSSAVENDQGTYCDLNPSNCLNCNSNLCNQVAILNDLMDCVYCDSQTNPDCALNPLAVKYQLKCNGGCMTALYPTANNYSYEVVRSCLNDKDAADQIACSNGSSNECISCSGSACNMHKLPESRLSCYHCAGESCEDARPSECTKYKTDDECFILFNSQSDITEMGCTSELAEVFVSDNLYLLLKCSSGDNCNSYASIPTPKDCSVCNSHDNEDCASNPENVFSVTRCSALPNTHCYTSVNFDGSTNRGCLNSLNKYDINLCLSGANTDCNVCLGDNCNVEIFPADRHSCHRCNTKNDPECESSPNFASICPVYSQSQFCATKLVNGQTYRGCSTEFQCDDSEKQYCRQCKSGDNCNTVDLATSNIGYPGNWQDVPINCYTCKNEECYQQQSTIQACSSNKLQNCATVFARNGTVVQRGCSDLIYNGTNLNYCDENPKYCKFCKSSGCNNAESLANFGECLFCDGADNTDCIFHPDKLKHTRSCHKGYCMTGLYPRKYEENPAYELVRGCWDDLDLDDREECKAGTKPYCQICERNSCNVAKIPQRRLKCNVCNGDDCAEPKSAECTAFRENDQCFTLFTDGNDVDSMGCASDFDNSELILNARQLLLCNGDNCNTFETFPQPITCRSCNSVDNPECASDPTVSTIALCASLPRAECVTHIDKNGVTHRGCLSDVDNDVFGDCASKNSTICEVCATDNCNAQVYPKGRRSCIRCDSAIFSACEGNVKDFASICSVYDENDSCVTTLDGDRTIRGCASEITCANSAPCRICNTTDNCNTINLKATYIGEVGKWQDLPLNCQHCKGEDCNRANATLSKCENNNSQTCMTVFSSEGAVILRGCSDAVISTTSEYCYENADNCVACKSNGCNNAKSRHDYIDCYFCDSAEDINCSGNFNASKTRTRKCQKSCMVALYPRNIGNDSAYELSRSCLDDMDSDDRVNCAAGNKDFCKACHGERCNTVDVPEERFECYKCIDEDCEDVETQQCSAYRPNDQCYSLYTNDGSIHSVGCLSEFETNVANDLVKQKLMLLCNGKNCNSPDTLPTPKLCSTCNSGENPHCATNPNLVNNITRCATLPYTECYTQIDNDGHTNRGCLGHLGADEFYDCLTNATGTCNICVGDKCNEIDVYPAKRMKCHQCISTSDPQCESIPNSNKVCSLYKEDDQCITNYSNGVTVRGCKSDVKCYNEKDPRSCRACEGDGCNIVNMKTVLASGLPGRWQETPISCYTCKGEEECKSKGVFRPCAKNPFQNCMTVFNSKTGKAFQRGCSDSLEKDHQMYCERNPGKCLRCNSNGCNEAADLNQYVECKYCDSDINGQCTSNVSAITATRQCYKFCMTALYPRFKEDNTEFGLSRSCYDDMDLDDREICAAGINEHCKICNRPGCNILDMPENRLSCYACEGVECESPKMQKCSTYRPNDKCYTRFNEKNEVNGHGCVSQFSNEEAEYLLIEKRLLLCDGENCNSLNNIPDVQTCILCNSRTDKNCAIGIDDLFINTKCAAKPYTNCYTRVLENGATERGCLSDLLDYEFLGCLNGTSTTCTSCTGNDCNKNIFPEFRLRCHVCDSNGDPECEAKPNSLSICAKYDAADNCVTTFRNNVTQRGCSSSLSCNDTNPHTCTKCIGSGCNTINLAAKQDNNFGMWQDLPLTCLSCSGSDCNSEANTKPVVCELNYNQDCVTVFNSSGKINGRGCSDSVDSEFCSANEENCYKCKSNNCNTATSKSVFKDCVYCNSYKNPDCVWNPLSQAHGTRKCQGGCMTALFPADNSENPAYGLIRTCLNDKELADQETCSKGNDTNCSACTADNCNTNSIPIKRLSCFICAGETCVEPKTELCPLFREDDQCFIKFDDTNSVSEMGCISSYHSQSLESIIKTKRVRTCPLSNCNSLDSLPIVESCAVCHSVEDEACAVSPKDIKTFKSCSALPYNSCYTKLTESGSTERGCLTELPDDDFVACVLGYDNNCTFCDKNACNREIFPENRQKCFTCIATEDPTCESNPTTTQACPIVSETESCITALSGNNTVRGCKSSVYCDANDSASCRSCFGTECNSIDLFNRYDDDYHGVFQQLPLQCHTCVGQHCLYSLGPAVVCSSSNINQDCMTVFDEEGRIARRGCSDDVEDYEDLYCRQNPDRCFKCKSNECNIAWSREEYVECLFCDSASHPLCANYTDNSGIISRQCYKNCMVALKSERLIRSCLDDKELFDQYQCQENNSKECTACSGKKCNDFIVPSDRLKCHVCTDSSCSSSISQYCAKYDQNDYCFAKYENGLVELLGCASSQNASTIAEWSAQHKLYECVGNDCNELSTVPKTEICLSCDSTTTPNCAQNPLQISATQSCAAPNNECFTRIDSTGQTIRGCYGNLNANEQTCPSVGTCALCTGRECNNEVYPANRLQCHICNSKEDGKCKTTPSSLQICPIFNANGTCVSALDRDDFLQRGCSSELQCSINTSDFCDVCNANGCNTVDLPGSANVATNSIFLTLLLACATLLIMK